MHYSPFSLFLKVKKLLSGDNFLQFYIKYRIIVKGFYKHLIIKQEKINKKYKTFAVQSFLNTGWLRNTKIVSVSVSVFIVRYRTF